MKLLFKNVSLWIDEASRSAAENMAVDEWLLDQLASQDHGVGALLRFYQWKRPSVTYGYFQSREVVDEFIADGYDHSRRFTGGGVVEHGDGIDLTYSLLVPNTGKDSKLSSFVRLSAGQRYATVHRQLKGALLASGLREDDVFQMCSGEDSFSGKPGQCFQEAVPADLLNKQGAKVAGAAQRRRRHGLLHQGSIDWQLLSKVRGTGFEVREFAEEFAGQLADCFQLVDFTPQKNQIEEMIAQRYGNELWIADKAKVKKDVFAEVG